MIGNKHDRISATSAEINEYLRRQKSLIEQGKVTFAGRKKNLDSLSRQNLLTSDAIYMIKQLKENDFKYKSPDKNNLSEYMWIFKKKLGKDLFYIKTKIKEEKDEMLLIMSFHIDE